jgi:hypothetical protein
MFLSVVELAFVHDICKVVSPSVEGDIELELEVLTVHGNP